MKIKRTQARVTLFISACFLGMILILFSCLVAFVLPQAPRYPEALMTAEYLEAFPMRSPTYLRIDEGCLNSRHCFLITLGSFPAMSGEQVYRMTRTLVLTIDGEIQRNYYVALIDSNLYAEIPALSEGLHLLEIEIRDKDKRLYRHSWVLRMEQGFIAQPTQALPPTPLISTP